jgi:hypothetical protein
MRQLYFRGKNPRYPLDRRLSGPQNRSGLGNRRRSSYVCQKSSLRCTDNFPAHYTLTIYFTSLNRHQNSLSISVGVATDLYLDIRGIGARFSAGARYFLLPIASRPDLGPTQWVLWAFFPLIKRPECTIDYSPPSSVEVKNAWIYASTPYYFMAWYNLDVTHSCRFSPSTLWTRVPPFVP